MRTKLSRTSITILSGLLVLVAILVFGSLSWPAAAQPVAQEQPEVATDATPRTLSTSGQGRVSVRPDTATVRFGVETQAETAVEALESNNLQMQEVISATIDAGVAEEDIQTQGLSLRPVYSEPSPTDETGEREITGYRATNVVAATVRDLENLGALLDDVVAAGGNTIQGIQFDVSNQEAVLDDAREAAWNNAVAKAEQLANLADVELIEVLTVSESSFLPGPVFREEAAFAADAAGVPVQPGQQEVEASVQVVWRIE